MNKLILISALVTVSLLTSVAAFAYSQSLNQSQSNQVVNMPPIPTATPTAAPTPTPTPALTPSPSPTETPPTDPAAYGSFGPLGNFGIISPTNKIYDTNILTLSFAGQTIVGSNVHLSISYSIDGQEKVPVNVEYKQVHDWDPFIGAFSKTVALPPLTSGAHSITVFGNLEANGAHLAQVTVYFTVQ